jgi:hypothetical protein
MYREKEKGGITYEAVKFTGNKTLNNFLKMRYESGKVKVAVVTSFLGVLTPSGDRWAKENPVSPYPIIQAVQRPLEEIENGFNLDDYFCYLIENKELEDAIVELVNTNTTASSDLLGLATKVLDDMKKNSIVVNKEDTNTYHRMVFSGA